MMSMAEYYTDLKRQIKAGEMRDPDGSQEPATAVSDCICEGKGFLVKYTGDVVPELVTCVCRCEDTRNRHQQMCIDNCRLDAETVERFSFGTWARVLNPGCGKAFESAKEFAEHPARWLILRGTSGLGKTHLAVAVVHHLAEQGVRAEYWRIQDLVSALHEAVAENALSAFTHDLTKLPVLAIDDYGAAYTKAFGELEIEGILDARYQRRTPTLITTNQTLSDFSPRLRSRLTDPSVVDLVELSGEDARPRLERS